MRKARSSQLLLCSITWSVWCCTVCEFVMSFDTFWLENYVFVSFAWVKHLNVWYLFMFHLLDTVDHNRLVKSKNGEIFFLYFWKNSFVRYLYWPLAESNFPFLHLATLNGQPVPGFRYLCCSIFCAEETNQCWIAKLLQLCSS